MLSVMIHFMCSYLMLRLIRFGRRAATIVVALAGWLSVIRRWAAADNQIRPAAWAILLAVILALSGQSMAVARGASTPTGEMILCTGTGPVTVLVDAEGKPTGAAKYCPDCVMSLLQAVAAGADWPVYQARVGQMRRVTSGLFLAAADQPVAQARGPPVRA